MITQITWKLHRAPLSLYCCKSRLKKGSITKQSLWRPYLSVRKGRILSLAVEPSHFHLKQGILYPSKLPQRAPVILCLGHSLKGRGGQLEQNEWKPTKSDLKTSRKGDASCTGRPRNVSITAPNTRCVIYAAGQRKESRRRGWKKKKRQSTCLISSLCLRHGPLVIRLMDCMSIESKMGSGVWGRDLMLDLFKLTMDNEKHHEDRTCISHYVVKAVITRKKYSLLACGKCSLDNPNSD